MDKPNCKFKIGDWVIGIEANTIFKVGDIRVFGDSFGYSNENIDGWFSENDLAAFQVSQDQINNQLAYIKLQKIEEGENA